MEIEGKYLLFLGDAPDRLHAKTASGILQWRPERCVGQLRLGPDTVDLGLPDMDPSQALAAGAGTLVIGVAPIGGGLDPAWMAPLRHALETGLDIASGLHVRLSAHAELAALAQAHGRRLFDVRHHDGGFPVASGRKRSGKRLLTVGTDCAVGKKYAALALHGALEERGVKATFRATGQTGILIAGRGVAIDAVVADFAAGAAEWLSPENDPDHWDLIEGQGSLFHPAYAGVSLALLHGSQPDALVVCHALARSHIDGYPDYPLPTIEDCIAANEQAARLTNPAARCVAVALDTCRVTARERDRVLKTIADRTGRATFDPIATGADKVADILIC